MKVGRFASAIKLTMLLELLYLGQWANAIRTCLNPIFSRSYISHTHIFEQKWVKEFNMSNLFQVIFDAGLAVQMSPKAGLTL